MKILFVDLEFDYGIPSRGPNNIGQLGFINSLRALGHEVIPFYWDKWLKNPTPMQPLLLQKADEIQPDLLFFGLTNDQFFPETLLALKNRYCTLNWFGDDSWRFDHFTKKYANYFTYCVTTDKFSIPKYHAIGQHNVIMSEWAAIPGTPPNSLQTDYEFEVSFIGGFNYERAWFLKQLRKRGIPVATFGNGWKNGPVSHERMNEIFLKSKINLNLSNSKSYDIRYALSHPMHLARVLKAKKNATQIKARHFEIPYAGGFQLADYSAGLEDFLTMGKEVVCYKDLDEATMLIRYYLTQNNEREEIKKAGFEAALSRHTYKNRLEDVIRKIT